LSTACGREYVVFSNRIPNSFDSRYYGPVHRRDILGVYAPIWIWDA
jgi:type IV secretory pathway protease TraF